MITEDQLHAVVQILAQTEPELLTLFNSAELETRIEAFVVSLLAQGRQSAAFS